MTDTAPSAAQADRFRVDLESLVGVPERLGLAVSGGPDSLALLLLAAAAFPGRVHAATVDHRLREGSAAEARAVGDLCGRIGCPHAILDVTVPDGAGGLQAEARAARYAALRQWAKGAGIPLLLTAHHADDQAETILMRLQRGAGLAGLSGIRPLRAEGDHLQVARPLLGWTKAELVAIVRAAGLASADDPSNRDARFDRARMRAFLADNPHFEPARLTRSAAALAEADQALDWAVEQLAEDRCTRQGDAWRIDPSGLPRALRRRLLARAIGKVREAHGIEDPWSGDVEALLATLERGATATLAGTLAKGGTAWHLRLAPPRR